MLWVELATLFCMPSKNSHFSQRCQKVWIQPYPMFQLHSIGCNSSLHGSWPFRHGLLNSIALLSPHLMRITFQSVTLRCTSLPGTTIDALFQSSRWVHLTISKLSMHHPMLCLRTHPHSCRRLFSEHICLALFGHGESRSKSNRVQVGWCLSITCSTCDSMHKTVLDIARRFHVLTILGHVTIFAKSSTFTCACIVIASSLR